MEYFNKYFKGNGSLTFRVSIFVQRKGKEAVGDNQLADSLLLMSKLRNCPRPLHMPHFFYTFLLHPLPSEITDLCM